MFVSSTLRYADAEYANPHEWRATLNGLPINAISANDERGFVDAFVTSDDIGHNIGGEAQYIVHRLFGDVRIELSSAQQQKLFATADTYTLHPVGMAADQWLRRINGDS